MDARRGKDKLLIQIESRLACGIDACDMRSTEHPWNVVGNGIADGCVGSSCDIANCKHIPQGYVSLEDELLLFLWRDRF